MAERKFEVRTIGVEYICDVCGDAAMEQTGIMLLTDPPQWPHKCKKCGHTANLYEKYPTTRFERVEQPNATSEWGE